MTGKVVGYNDNTDAFEIIDEREKRYYGFECVDGTRLNIGDVVLFEVRVLYPGEYETYLAINIVRLSKTNTYKLSKKSK